ncbi:hypothetical protein GCM10010249_14900 [Streptomyces roseolilacinus]|uniref:Uncharacterized protein n=1 Tax=Streptomyces roseolilacinus TaxID=66904 RepID=A0A918AZL5_9ACTN|nr:hypothetical protein GCM10010249_14900 [Streptomyces roseolilacinus]
MPQTRALRIRNGTGGRGFTRALVTVLALACPLAFGGAPQAAAVSEPVANGPVLDDPFGTRPAHGAHRPAGRHRGRRPGATRAEPVTDARYGGFPYPRRLRRVPWRNTKGKESALLATPNL